MRRLTVTACVVLALVWSAPSSATLFVMFSPTRATPGDVITVRTGNTPLSFRASDRKRPLQRPITIYLVANDIADDVDDPDDLRLHRLGRLIPDKNGMALKDFRVPAVPAGRYAAAFLCPGCAQYSEGDTFWTLRVDENILPEYRQRLALVVLSNDSWGGALTIGRMIALALGTSIVAWLLIRLLFRRRARQLIKSTPV